MGRACAGLPDGDSDESFYIGGKAEVYLEMERGGAKIDAFAARAQYEGSALHKLKPADQPPAFQVRVRRHPHHQATGGA